MQAVISLSENEICAEFEARLNKNKMYQNSIHSYCSINVGMCAAGI